MTWVDDGPRWFDGALISSPSCTISGDGSEAEADEEVGGDACSFAGIATSQMTLGYRTGSGGPREWYKSSSDPPELSRSQHQQV